MALFSHSTTIPRSQPRLPLGLSLVDIADISKPRKTEIEIDGVLQKQRSVKFTFTAVGGNGELTLDCMWFISPNSKLTKIFQAVDESFDPDSEEDVCLEPLKEARLVVDVEDVESKNGNIYRTITGFFPADYLDAQDEDGDYYE